MIKRLLSLLNNRGEITTALTLIGLGIVTVGILIGRQLANQGPRDIPKAQTSCLGVQHCTYGGSTLFEYCGECTGAGCRPGFACADSRYTCKTYPNIVFYFDNLYPVSCALLSPQPPTQTPTTQPPAPPTLTGCQRPGPLSELTCTPQPDGIQINWNYIDSGQSGFNIYRNTTSFLTNVGRNDRTFLDTTTNCNITYQYTVWPFNSCGENGSIANLCTARRICISPTPTPTPTSISSQCLGVQHCTYGGTTLFEYCGECSGLGCRPGFACADSRYTCKTYPNIVFYFDNLYPVSCSLLTPQPPTRTPTPQPACIPTLSSPADAAVIQLSGSTGQVNLKWNFCSGINNYQLYITTRQAGCVLGSESGSATGIITGNLYTLDVQGESNYTWKVRSCPLSSTDPNCPGGSSFSAIRSFTTVSSPSPTPCASETPTPTSPPYPQGTCQCDLWNVTADACVPPDIAVCTGKFSCACQPKSRPTRTPTVTPSCLTQGAVCNQRSGPPCCNRLECVHYPNQPLDVGICERVTTPTPTREPCDERDQSRICIATTGDCDNRGGFVEASLSCPAGRPPVCCRKGYIPPTQQPISPGIDTGGLSGDTNAIYRQVIDRFVKELLNIFQLNNFILQITRVPGIQTQYCEVPCQFQP